MKFEWSHWEYVGSVQQYRSLLFNGRKILRMRWIGNHAPNYRFEAHTCGYDFKPCACLKTMERRVAKYFGITPDQIKGGQSCT